MAKVAEGIARVADGIATGRRQRRELGAEIYVATRIRRSEVRSLLEGLKASRGRASREDRREAAAINSRRKSEVTTLLTRFGRERVARQKHCREVVAAQRDRAAAFMRDLTGGVAALRDRFAKDGRDRAAGIHKRLAAYALDRREAIAIWRGSPRRGQQAGVQTAETRHRPATEPAAVRAEPPAPASAPAEAHEAAGAAAQSADEMTRSSRLPFGNLGHRGSKEPRGGDSK